MEEVRSDTEPGGGPTGAPPARQVVSQVYDERMRPTHTKYGKAPFQVFEELAVFDQVGNLRTAHAPQDPSTMGSTVTRARPRKRQSSSTGVDGLGRTTTILDTDGIEVGKVVLDLAGRITEIQRIDSRGNLKTTQTRSYDQSKARLTTINDHFDSGIRTTTLEYVPSGMNGEGQLQKTTDPLGVTATRTYDPEGRLRDVTTRTASGTLLSKFDFSLFGKPNRRNGAIEAGCLIFIACRPSKTTHNKIKNASNERKTAVFGDSKRLKSS